MTTPPHPALAMKNITKSFGNNHANRGINFQVDVGEIHGLLGENGAGKSTLMNILYGLITPDAGLIEVMGEPVQVSSPAVALRHGIGMVHQHFMLIPAFTVLENLVLGAEPHRGPRLDTSQALIDVRRISERFGLTVSPDAYVSDLGVAARQRVEILRALYRGARILILDEPTAVLTPQESTRLLGMLREMAAQSLSVILISHKLPELLDVTGRVTVLRDGQLVDTVQTATTTAEQLAAMMVGRDTDLTLNLQPRQTSAQPLLSLHGVSDRDGRVNGVDLAVHGGEIVGIAGVDGSGQLELLELVSGLRPVGSGRIQLGGVDVTHAAPRHRLASGLAYIPEERRNEGLVMELPVYENAILRRHHDTSLRRAGLLSRALMRRRADELNEAYDVRPRDVNLDARALSGGNQQKLLVARELRAEPDVLVVNQPTRGVDVTATNMIHRRLIEARDSGRAVLLSSLDLDEVKSLCDRVLVMFRGQVTGVLARRELSDRSLGLLMTGAGQHDGTAAPTDGPSATGPRTT